MFETALPVFRVRDDIDALHREFVARGVVPPSPPTDQTWGMRELVVRDGDGNVITFGQRLPVPI